jgi:hypothetical protein
VISQSVTLGILADEAIPGDQTPAVLGQLQYAWRFAGLNVNDLKFPLSEDD